MSLYNLTPHSIGLLLGEEGRALKTAEEILNAPSSLVKQIPPLFEARATMTTSSGAERSYAGGLEGVYVSPQGTYTIAPISESQCAHLREGDSVIVSSIFLEALKASGKPSEAFFGVPVKVLVPDSNPKTARRNDKGQIIAVEGLLCRADEA